MPAQPILLPVREAPFAHVLADGWLEADLYTALCRSFPDCPPGTGPTGFTLFWGDPAYDRLMADNPAWRSLFERFHAQPFIDYCLAQFAETFASEARFDLSAARYAPYRESRADKERPALPRVELAPEQLWVRLDIMQGLTGYARAPHLDHRRRAVSMLLYFCDADENEMEGGDLVLHGAGGEEEVVRPRHNRMVAFPCHGRSLHSVSRIASQARPRNFVQVTVSSSVDLWPAEEDTRPSRTSILDLPRRLGRWRAA
jgi:hypothetical protein